MTRSKKRRRRRRPGIDIVLDFHCVGENYQNLMQGFTPITLKRAISGAVKVIKGENAEDQKQERKKLGNGPR